MSTPTSIRTHRPTGDPDPGRDWRHDAACLTADPELFFPLSGSETTKALQWCRACPVRRACLDDALAGGHGGVRGGMSEDARHRAARRRAVQS